MIYTEKDLFLIGDQGKRLNEKQNKGNASSLTDSHSLKRSVFVA